LCIEKNGCASNLTKQQIQGGIVVKVLAINGSHRKGKNTANMLNIVLEEAKAEGADTELLEITDFNIKPCLSCNQCLRKTSCSIQDDVQVIANKMMEADAVILGSPVYFGNVTGLLKMFMDRTRWMHMCQNLLEGHIGAAVTVAGLRNGGQEVTLNILERFLQSHGLMVVDSRNVQGGIYNIGAVGSLYESLEGEQIRWNSSILDDPLVLHQCRQLGRNIVKAIGKWRG